jgi:hypothetical protein
MEKIADLLREEAVSGGDAAVHKRRQARFLTESAVLTTLGKACCETPLGPVGLILINFGESRADQALLRSLSSTKPE